MRIVGQKNTEEKKLIEYQHSVVSFCFLPVLMIRSDSDLPDCQSGRPQGSRDMTVGPPKEAVGGAGSWAAGEHIHGAVS